MAPKCFTKNATDGLNGDGHVQQFTIKDNYSFSSCFSW